VRPVITKWNWGCWSRVLQVARDYKCGIIHIQYQTAAYGMHPAINLLPLRVRREYNRPRILVTFISGNHTVPKAGADIGSTNGWRVTAMPLSRPMRKMNKSCGTGVCLLRHI